MCGAADQATSGARPRRGPSRPQSATCSPDSLRVLLGLTKQDHLEGSHDGSPALAYLGRVRGWSFIRHQGEGSSDHGATDKGDGGLMAPVQSLHAHFCGIHIAKNNPKFQLVAQHFCMAHRGDASVPSLRLVRQERQAAGRRVYHRRPAVPRAPRHREEVLAPAHLRGAGRWSDRSRHEAGRRDDVHEGTLDHLGQDVAHLARPQDAHSDGRAALDVGGHR